MRKLSLIFLVIWLFSINVFAQETRLVDEFGSLYCDDLLQRLDSLAVEVNNSPNQISYVIVYEGKYRKSVYDRKGNFIKHESVLPMFGESTERTRTMMDYLINFRRFPEEKIMFISGGFREEHLVQLWIVPKGEKMPEIKPTLETMQYRKGTPIDICDGIG